MIMMTLNVSQTKSVVAGFVGGAVAIGADINRSRDWTKHVSLLIEHYWWKRDLFLLLLYKTDGWPSLQLSEFTMADSALSQTQFKSLCGKLYSLLTHRRASKEDVETPMDIPKTSEAQQQQQQQEEEKLQLHAYPNCDLDIWLRSCREEIIKPLNGKTTGTIPTWINGCLYRNGPGKMTYGENDVSHLFDSAGLLHGYFSLSFHYIYIHFSFHVHHLKNKFNLISNLHMCRYKKKIQFFLTCV